MATQTFMNVVICRKKYITHNGSLHILKIVFFPFVGSKSPPIKALKWLKDGQLLTEKGRPKVQIFDTMLRVNNVQTEDGGVYQCFITLDSGLEIQSSGELRLGGEDICYILLLLFLLLQLLDT